MEQFQIIYRILRVLQRAMGTAEFDSNLIGAEALGINSVMWARLMRLLVKEGYIDGVTVIESDLSDVPVIRAHHPAITLKGLEYLEENGLMKKAMELAKNVRGIVG